MDAIGHDAGNSIGLDSRRDGRSWLSVRPSGAWIMQGTSDSNERLVRKATDLSSMSIHLSHLRMLSTVAYMTVNSNHA
jgi:hypothetical protein